MGLTGPFLNHQLVAGNMFASLDLLHRIEERFANQSYGLSWDRSFWVQG